MLITIELCHHIIFGSHSKRVVIKSGVTQYINFLW